ncbi:MAG: hypothetical protein V1745_02660 [Patescibacteria group bacterium]
MKISHLKVFGLILAGLIGAVVLHGIESAKSAHTQPPRTKMESTVAKSIIEYEKDPHVTTALAWRNAAQYVTDATKDAEAGRVMEYLLTSVGFGLPGNNSVTVLRVPQDAKSKVLLVPILQEDERLDPGLKRMNQSETSVALYRPSDKVIVIRSERMSTVWKGLLLLHETKHAMSFAQKPYDSNDLKQLCYEELATLEFHCRLMSEIGGETYARVLRAEVDRLRGHPNTKIDSYPMKFPDRSGYEPMLEKAFGPSESDLERSSRQTQVWVHAVFKLLEADYAGSDKDDTKARFIWGFYRLLGI